MTTIVTKYHGPTNTRGSQISASDGDGNSLSGAYDDGQSSEDNHFAACRALCHKMGWHGKLQSGLASLLGLLSAAADAYAYSTNGRASDNADLFPSDVMEWAHSHSDELSYLAYELEETQNVIEE